MSTMKIPFISIVVVVLLPLCFGQNSFPKIEKWEKSFRCIGEMIYSGQKSYQNVFEENYNMDTNISSLLVSTDGVTDTIQYNLNENKCWNYNDQTCVFCQMSSHDPELPIQTYTSTNGQVVVPVRQLLLLGMKNVEKWGQEKVPYRGVSAYTYTYRFSGKRDMDTVEMTIDSYWSDGDNPSPSQYKTVPLGFKINEVVLTPSSAIKKISVQYVNLFLFTHNEFNQAMFLPKRGLVCPGFGSNQKKFPDVSGLKSGAFRIEMIDMAISDATYYDVWIDFEKKLLRSDYLITHGPYASHTTSMIVSFDQKTIYTVTLNGKIPTNFKWVEDLDNQMGRPGFQEVLFNVTNRDKWTIEDFFGIRDQSYNYIGQGTVTMIPCDIFQVERTDWQPFFADEHTKYIFEWCIPNLEAEKIQYPKDSFPTSSLKIYPSPDQTMKAAALGVSPVKLQFKGLVFNFYNIKRYNADYLDTFAFDIADAFSDNHKVKRSFKVHLTMEVASLLKDTMNDLNFDSSWRLAITTAAKLTPTSLRVTRVKTTMLAASGPMMVYFTLLDRHPDLPAAIKKKEIPLDKAISNLEDAINKQSLKISWVPDFKKTVILTASRDSLLPNQSPEIQRSDSVVTEQTQRRKELSPMAFALEAQKQERKKLQDNTTTGKNVIYIGSISAGIGLALGAVATWKVKSIKKN